MNKKSFGFLFILLITILLSSCDGFNKLSKSKDYDKKYEAALDYYEKKDYFKAQQLFDELLVIFRGQPRAEEVFFKYAYSYYHMGDYLTAAFYFQKYAVTFPKSGKTEEAFFMSAYCKYLDSPKFSLDQASTYDAISQLQTFINIYSNSPRVDTANMYIDELRLKLERKGFEKAKLYHTTGYDRSAITALTLFVKNNPGSLYREEAMFLLLDASFRYASNSVAAKKAERLQDSRQAYQTYVASFPEGSFRSRADAISKRIESEIAKINIE
ncbi:MAG: outer membrane protein assembly factor BamD [Desulfobacteraceae bacterium]|nr:MAG: outer membrane protein assembly factor BamD [Desulfobacteraceae bacterium]